LSQGAFRTTRWSVILNAGDLGKPAAGAALADLCEAYWHPVYVFVRRSGYPADEARDLTQEYFARMIEREHLADVKPGLGKFRSFLLASVKHFLANARRDANAQKRGGGTQPLSLDGGDAEQTYRLLPSDERTPESAYEYQWALTLLDRARARMAEELARIGKQAQFEAAAGHLGAARDPLPYTEIAERLDVSVDAAKMVVSRLRKRYGRVLREEIAETLDAGADVEDEARSLLSILHG
jgi:RNA polymerase sigma-70 factor (ECF subfamily)